MVTPQKAVLIEWFEQKLDFLESERECIVKKRIDQPFVKSGDEKREATARKDNRTKVQPEYS